MPINKQEFENGKLHSKLEDEIIFFLDERKGRAFTSQEVMEGIRYHTEFSTPEISKMSTFAIADFTAFLQHLIEKGKIKMKIVRGRMYIMARRENLAKCPKCGEEVEPKKTWMMAGRPNKRGERTQLQIGHFNCPKHGAFRKVLDKKKIRARPSTKPLKKEKKKASVKKQTRKKKTTREKKKARKKKPTVWKLV
jgi:hypothetical protein